MYVISNEYKSLIESNLSLSPKSKIVVDNIEYDGSVLKTYPKITHKNSTMIGGFPAKTCSFEIYDIDNNLDFEGKEITVYRGLDIDGITEWIPQGIFIPTADKITTNISTKTITFNGIQDKSQLFDLMYDSNLNWSDDLTHTGLEIVQEICIKLGITLETTTFNWYNYNFKQPNFSSNTTYREVISKLAEIGGSIAYVSRTGGLVIKKQTYTGHSIERKRYSRLSKEKQFGIINVVVLGKDGINDDIVYPNILPSDIISWKILDNPFVDLYREEMIETVASYIIGQSIIPFTLNDFVDGFYLDLNDTIQVVDKNGNMFNATILNYESTSRIKSNVSANVQNNSTTNYKLAGSFQKTINDLKFDVDHINNQIDVVVTSTELVESQVIELQESIKYFSVDLSQYNLTIPTSADKKPLLTKNYDINFYAYFKGQQVTPSVTITGSNTGITTTKTDTYIRFAVNANTAIANDTNEYTIEFSYSDGQKSYSNTKKINIALAIKGQDGENGADGAPGQPGQDGAPGENGKSAYQVWLDAGNTGTEEDYLNSLKGENGTSTYFYVRYSANASGNPMTITPQSDTKYMGVASTTSPTAPTSSAAYTWTLIKGADGQNGADGQDGIPGQAGTDGQTSYLHVKYSENGNSFTPASDGYAEGEKPSAYIGTYVDFTEADSTNFDDYTWYKFTEDIDSTLDDMQNQISDNAVATENNYQDIIGRLDGYATTEVVTQQISSMTAQMTSTELQINAINQTLENGVEKVVTSKGFTFDDEGLTIDNPNGNVKNKIDETAVEIIDKSTNTSLLFAGFDTELQETLVRSNNLTVTKYLKIPHSRFEKYNNPTFGNGTGCFYIEE